MALCPNLVPLVLWDKDFAAAEGARRSATDELIEPAGCKVRQRQILPDIGSEPMRRQWQALVERLPS